MQCHLDCSGVSGQRLIDGVVDDLLGQVVWTRGVGVHAGPALDRIQAGENFDIGGVVTGVHAWFACAFSGAGVIVAYPGVAC